MIKVPDFDMTTRPYVFLKDRKGISIVDVKERKICPLINSPLELDMQRLHNFSVEVWNSLDDTPRKSLTPKLTNVKNIPNIQSEDTLIIHSLEYSRVQGVQRSNLSRYILDMS